MTAERALTAALVTVIAGALGGIVWLAAAGFFDRQPRGPQPCPAVWRADCEAAR